MLFMWICNMLVLNLMILRLSESFNQKALTEFKFLNKFYLCSKHSTLITIVTGIFDGRPTDLFT